MHTRKTAKAIEPMKQAKLSFTSKRTASGTVAGKSSKAARKQPARASSSPTSGEVIDISESSDDELDVPVVKKRRLALKAQPVVLKEDGDTDADAERAEEGREGKEPLHVSDKRWRKLYGESRSKMGDIEPVHAKGQTMVNHILRVFDLSYEYGPCVGVSRLERWERAQALGLSPPPEVKEILLTEEGSTDTQYTQSVFYGEV
ncbi:DNA polymerase delta, subunit 4-domain-containing protein [Cerioporus squamosus]|nr:DNA polymerase delta, subunit 4-domain-containing protein [Cerioporus squamosus]